MIYHLFLYFCEPPGQTWPNPFLAYDHGLGLLLFLEICMIGISLLVSKTIASRVKCEYVKKFTVPLLFVLYYVAVWACFWIEYTYVAFLASAACVLIISIIAYVAAVYIYNKMGRNKFE